MAQRKRFLSKRIAAIDSNNRMPFLYARNASLPIVREAIKARRVNATNNELNSVWVRGMLMSAGLQDDIDSAIARSVIRSFDEELQTFSANWRKHMPVAKCDRTAVLRALPLKKRAVSNMFNKYGSRTFFKQVFAPVQDYLNRYSQALTSSAAARALQLFKPVRKTREQRIHEMSEFLRNLKDASSHTTDEARTR